MNSRKTHTIGNNRFSIVCVRRERILRQAARAVSRPALAIAFLAALLVSAGSLAQAQTLNVLHAFTGADGSHSQSGVIADALGNLYGMTYDGGTYGYGTVFELPASGRLKVLYNFTGADGAFPLASLVRDAQGNLYGTASGYGNYGGGTAFILTPSGVEKVLFDFNGANGNFPASTLVPDMQGNLFGTTFRGGAYGYGMIFTVSPTAKSKVVYSFTGGADGGNPFGGLIRDSQGNLYGTTFTGGAAGINGAGTVFVITPPAYRPRVLYNFIPSRDGWGVYGSLVQDAQGNLYGATYFGGAHGDGTVFEIPTTAKKKCSTASLGLLEMERVPMAP